MIEWNTERCSNYCVLGRVYKSLLKTVLFIVFGIRTNDLISGKSLLLYQLTKRVTKLTVIIIVGYHCYQLYTTLY
jgi:hypothetical protein